MQIYFGDVPEYMLEHQGPDEFFHYGGKYYLYRVDFQEDQVCFYDTCDRHFPIDMETYHEFMTAAECMNALRIAREDAQEIMDDAMQNVVDRLDAFNFVKGQ